MAPEADGPAEVNEYELVDDMEQTDPFPVQGLAGFVWSRGIGNWFVRSADGDNRDASIASLEPARDQSEHAYHVTSAKPVVAVDLYAELSHPWQFTFDLSEYVGIVFWARSDVVGGVELLVGFDLLGGYFIAEPAEASFQPLHVTAEWQEFAVLFSDVAADSSAIQSFDFVLGEDGEPFDFWLDDVRLICTGSCPEG